MTGLYSTKIEGDRRSSILKSDVVPLSYNSLNDYTGSERKLLEYNAQKPILPSINHLINSSPLRDSNDEGRWSSIPRTPNNSTPLQSPPSSSKVSPVNLPSIRNNLKGDNEKPWLQHFPNSQQTLLTDIKNDNSFAPSINRTTRSMIPDSDPPTPDRQIQQHKVFSQEPYGQNNQRDIQVNVQMINNGVSRNFSTAYPPPTPPDIRHNSLDQLQIQQPQPQPQPQSHYFHHQDQQPVVRAQTQELRSSQLRGGIAVNHIAALSGSAGVNANNGNSNQMYGLGIYPITQEGNVVQNGLIYNGISANDQNGDDGRDYYDRYSAQPYSRYCGDYQSMLEISSSSYQLQPLITASKDIKRRTKTGCMTCRRRRIKCDERHPTCLNCEKSKRVCLGYDPVFRSQPDKRRRKAASWCGESSYGCHKKPHSLQDITPTPISEMTGSFKNDCNGSGDSPLSGQASSTLSCINTPVTIDGSIVTPPSPSANNDSTSSQEKNRCRIKIASLLDAAVVIESQSSSSLSSNGNNIERQLSPSRANDFETGSYFIDKHPSWEDICEYFAEKVAVDLDDMFSTKRFSEVALNCNRKPSGSGRHSKLGGTEDLAVLETIRQIFSILHPSIYVDNLALDENAKLEELRITNNYKLMRCILQLISSDRDTEFLPVAVEDYEIFLKVSTLHQFIYGGTIRRSLIHDGSQSLNSPVSPNNEGVRMRNIPEIDENINREEVWKLLQFIGNGGNLYESDVEAMEISCQMNISRMTVGAISVAILLGLHYTSTNSTTCKNDSRIRLRLLELSGTGTLSTFLRRLIDMTLNL